jgi:hypothetical protein
MNVELHISLVTMKVYHFVLATRRNNAIAIKETLHCKVLPLLSSSNVVLSLFSVVSSVVSTVSLEDSSVVDGAFVVESLSPCERR